MMERVSVELDDALTPPPTWSGFPAVVTVEGPDGTVQARIERPLGYPERPMSPGQLEAKFLLCTEGALGPGPARAAYDGLAGRDVFGRLQDLLTPAGS
jgi:2-methylcitrate dehydratase PrpD